MKGAKTILLMLVLTAVGVLSLAQDSDSRAQPPAQTDVIAAPAPDSREADQPKVTPAPVMSKPVVKKDPGQTDKSVPTPPPTEPERYDPAPPQGAYGEPDDPAPNHWPPRGKPPDDPHRRHHGRHDEWRHRHYGSYGSWRFLWHLGPIIITPPHPPIVRPAHYRPKVYVRHTGSDEVGVDFASAVRDELRDRGLKVVYSPSDATLELYLLTMEEDNDDPGYNSAVSVSYIWQPGNKFITAQMLDVGAGEIDDLAGMVAEYADDLTDDYR